jgi:hypothetical protein
MEDNKYTATPKIGMEQNEEEGEEISFDKEEQRRETYH